MPPRPDHSDDICKGEELSIDPIGFAVKEA